MFFILSKTVAVLLLPSNILIAIGIAGVVFVCTPWRRLGQWLMVISLVLLAFAAFLPVGAVLEHVLESRFPPWDPSRGPPDGIIILGGAINPALSRAYGATQLNENGERITAIAKLAQQYPNARIVYSGGSGSIFGEDVEPEARFLPAMLSDLGVPASRVTLEERSRNTHENAVFSEELIKPKPGERWLLVTSAWHMPRSVGCFRRVGFPVEAYPVDWHASPDPDFRLSSKFGAGLRDFDDAVHEWTGLFVYWLTGRTSAFFPGPG